MTTVDLARRTPFTCTGDPAFVMDAERGRILAANDAGCSMLGYTRTELLATPIAAIHPAELKELSELLGRVHREQRASTIKLTCRTKQGVFLPTEITLHSLVHDGCLRILGLIRDRSEHRACRPDE
jgi:PAS domain S-box-containing protein